MKNVLVFSLGFPRCYKVLCIIPSKNCEFTSREQKVFKALLMVVDKIIDKLAVNPN